MGAPASLKADSISGWLEAACSNRLTTEVCVVSFGTYCEY